MQNGVFMGEEKRTDCLPPCIHVERITPTPLHISRLTNPSPSFIPPIHIFPLFTTPFNYPSGCCHNS